VARHALVPWSADTGFAAQDRREVTVLVIALERAVAGGMAVHAARIHDHLRGLAEQRAGARLRIRNACERRWRAQIVAALRHGARAAELAQQHYARYESEHRVKHTSPLNLRILRLELHRSSALLIVRLVQRASRQIVSTPPLTAGRKT
jgi:homogentisate 1,2-dioxygenase